MEDVIDKIFPLYKKNFYRETKLTCWWSFPASRFLLFSETCLVSNTLVPSMFIWSNIWWAKFVGTAPSTNSFFPGCILKCAYIRILFIQSLWKWSSHKTEFLVVCIALFTSQNQKLIKFFWQCQLLFLFFMYNGFIFVEKGVFYILTAFFPSRKMFRLTLSAKILSMLEAICHKVYKHVFP